MTSWELLNLEAKRQEKMGISSLCPLFLIQQLLGYDIGNNTHLTSCFGIFIGVLVNNYFCFLFQYLFHLRRLLMVSANMCLY